MQSVGRVAAAGEREAFAATPLPQLSELASLSDAERDVAFDLLRGATAAAIAERRGVSRHTVETQIKSLYEKLGVRSRIELASRLGEIPK